MSFFKLRKILWQQEKTLIYVVQVFFDISIKKLLKTTKLNEMPVLLEKPTKAQITFICEPSTLNFSFHESLAISKIRKLDNFRRKVRSLNITEQEAADRTSVVRVKVERPQRPKIKMNPEINYFFNCGLFRF